MNGIIDFFRYLMEGFGLNDVLDILITAFVVYKILGFIRETRAQQLVKGLLILVVAYFISDFLDLDVINWLLRSAFTFGIFALVVVFQPELRRGLEFMGRSKFGVGRIGQVDKDRAMHVVDEITNVPDYFSESKTGALIIFEREITLEDISETGTYIDAEISEQLLGNIFYEGAPLHDGAVIIRGDRVYAAGCVLPLTENKNLNKSLGTRHRAGIGISEKSDALVLIVSEETGIISVAEDGKLRRFLDKRSVEKTLLNLYITDEQDAEKNRLGRIGRLFNRTKSGTSGKEEKDA